MEVKGLTSQPIPRGSLATALTAGGPSAGGEPGGAAQALRQLSKTEEADRQPSRFGVQRSVFMLQV